MIQRIGTAKYVVFAVGNEAGADAYLAMASSHNPDPTPDAVWYPADAVDAYGRRVVLFLGPGSYNISQPIPGEEAARLAANGVLQTGVDRDVEA